MYTRIAIQILSFNRPEYLKQTLASLQAQMSPLDKICVLEQSTEKASKKAALEICEQYPNVRVISLYDNMGQRGGTNMVFNAGFFNGSDYVMISDQDNLFHAPLSLYCEKLYSDPSIWIATGYMSPEHDVERKDWEWIIKSTARAGHMVFRTKDFLAMMPIDVNYTAGTSCAWFAGLDWYLSWWHPLTPGFQRKKEFIACYPAGVEHIGRDSAWQGHYDDEIDMETCRSFRPALLSEVLEKHPPRHAYLSYKYSYEQ
jgi:hypothetical protein